MPTDPAGGFLSPDARKLSCARGRRRREKPDTLWVFATHRKERSGFGSGLENVRSVGDSVEQRLATSVGRGPKEHLVKQRLRQLLAD
jgi:hypothetical protein